MSRARKEKRLSHHLTKSRIYHSPPLMPSIHKHWLIGGASYHKVETYDNL